MTGARTFYNVIFCDQGEGDQSRVTPERIPSTVSPPEVTKPTLISVEPITTTTESSTTTSSSSSDNSNNIKTGEELNILVINPTSSLAEDQTEDKTDFDHLEHDSEEVFVEEQEKRKPKSKFENLKLTPDEAEEENKSIEDERHSAELSFKERLKARFKKFRQEHGDILVQSKDINSETRPVPVQLRPSDTQAHDKEDKERPKFGTRTDFIRKKLAEVLKHTSKTEETTFQRTFVPSFLRTESKADFTRVRPTIVRSLFTVDASTRAPFSFNRNKAFKRPQIRKNILNKILGKVKEDDEDDEVENVETEVEDHVEKENDEDGKVTIKNNVENDAKYEEETTTDLDIEPSTTSEMVIKTSELTQDIPIFHQFSPTETELDESRIVSSIEEKDVTQSTSIPTPSFVELEPTSANTELQTTILVKTEEKEGALYEVATIKSAYSFSVEGGELSTRYITVTRTSSSHLTSPPARTLEVSTSGGLEVATIRSPYSFQVDDEGHESTRYVTVTRTADITPLSPVTSLPFDIIDFNPSPLQSSISEDIVTR